MRDSASFCAMMSDERHPTKCALAVAGVQVAMRCQPRRAPERVGEGLVDPTDASARMVEGLALVESDAFLDRPIRPAGLCRRWRAAAVFACSRVMAATFTR